MHEIHVRIAENLDIAGQELEKHFNNHVLQITACDSSGSLDSFCIRESLPSLRIGRSIPYLPTFSSSRSPATIRRSNILPCVSEHFLSHRIRPLRFSPTPEWGKERREKGSPGRPFALPFRFGAEINIIPAACPGSSRTRPTRVSISYLARIFP